MLRDSLSTLGERYGTDKGTIHTYLDTYERILRPIQLNNISLLEIGIFNGASLEMWLGWLPYAQIYGIDLKLPNLVRDRLLMYVCEQTDRDQLGKLFKPDSLDVIIDDGSHRLSHQLLTLHYLWPTLKPGGRYFIEDVQSTDYIKYFNMFSIMRTWIPEDGQRYDNTLVMLVKEQY